MDTPIISIRGLRKNYGANQVLRGIDMDIYPGQVIGYIGPNGAGKTTMFRLMLDLISATEGEVTSGDKKVKQSDHWKLYTGSYLDEGFLISFLTPREYMKFAAGLHGLGENDIIDLIQFTDGFVNEELLLVYKFLFLIVNTQNDLSFWFQFYLLNFANYSKKYC